MADQRKEVRISFTVPPELKERLNDKVPWGDVKKIYLPLTEQLVELMEEHDASIVKAGIISKKIPLERIIDYNKDKESDAT